MKIKGTIVQKVPPEQHKNYIQPWFDWPENKTILTVKKPETPNTWIERFIEAIRQKIKSRLGEDVDVDGFYWTVAVDSCPEGVGNEIELETEPHMVESGLLLGRRC